MFQKLLSGWVFITDETILITGASSDIGCALIRHLLSQPHAPRVIAHSFRSAAKLAELQADFGERLHLMEADLSQSSTVLAMADSILTEFGTPSGFVHLSALRPTYDRFTKFKWERFQEDQAIQMQSAVLLLQRFLPKMVKLSRGSVVFVLSSVVCGVPPKFMSMYTIAKYTQLGLMRALAAEYAATSVRINAVSPSMVETKSLSDIAPLAVEMAASANPLGRNARPDDLMAAIDLLLSPGCGYIQGVNLPITAGTSV